MATSTSHEISQEVKRTSATICEFEWSIQNFISLSDKTYFSPRFSFARGNCVLYIVPNGAANTDSLGYIDLCFCRSISNSPINLEVSFSFKTSDGKEVRGRYGAYCNNDEMEIYTALRCISRSELLKRKSELLPSNVLTVLCTFKYSKYTKDASEGCTLGTLINPRESKVLHDLKKLFVSKEDCDVVMKVKGQEFTAHKNILKARSSVFASTFRNDMKEKATGAVEIEDCDPASFSDFLCFIYCGDTENITQENVFSLFTAADKYDVQDLRAKCLEFIRENLSVDTFCDAITLALRHSERELIELTTDFFLENAREITLTVKWQTFLAENPIESNELIVKLLASNCSISSK